jgi:hypothetical protein
MARGLLLSQLEAARAQVFHAEDLVARARAVLPLFSGTPMESDAQNLAVRLEDCLAGKIADMERLLDLLDGDTEG